VRRGKPHWRAGQALFNCLCHEQPQLAEAIRGTKLDPFHSIAGDVTYCAAQAWLADNWPKEQP
jgi:hypothetical protein